MCLISYLPPLGGLLPDELPPDELPFELPLPELLPDEEGAGLELRSGREYSLGSGRGAGAVCCLGAAAS